MDTAYDSESLVRIVERLARIALVALPIVAGYFVAMDYYEYAKEIAADLGHPRYRAEFLHRMRDRWYEIALYAGAFIITSIILVRLIRQFREPK